MNSNNQLKLGVAIALIASAAGCDGSAQSPRAEAGGFDQLDHQIERLPVLGSAPPPVVRVKTPADGASATSSAKAPSKTDDDSEPLVDADADLKIKRLVIAHGVENREPIQPATQFVKGEQERIYAFVEVGNQDRAHSEIFVTFVRKGADERGQIRLRVGASPRWRTWAYTRLARDEGEWVAIVRNARGDELARAEFEIRGAGPAETVAPDSAA
ncbi:MAG: DUF2914 domain-containing protein [Deltaproteobacteria bacterium]|nr:DUF2914 domain-containing protein [Deltaproteobacteria bacterium]